MKRNVGHFLTLDDNVMLGITEILLAGDEMLNNIRTWLSPPDPSKNFNIALKSRYSDTGAWFVKGNTLSEWKASGPSSLLWINGKRQLPPCVDIFPRD